MLQLLSFIHFLDGKKYRFLESSSVFWKISSVFGLFEQFFIDFRLDFSRFWPFTATSHLTTTALNTLYLEAFPAMCGRVAAKI